jgi:hypothetical protein
MGGPPPAHFAGVAPSGTLFAHCPLTHPLPTGHWFMQLPQWLLSFAMSTQV